MSGPVPTAKGWYPDPDTGGTKYWDGSRWTGDVRPRRRPFAAASSQREVALPLLLLAVLFPAMGVMALRDPESSEPVTTFTVTLVFGLVLAIAGVYLLRGQGPSTASIEKRLADEEKEAKAKRRAGNVAGFAAGIVRAVQGQPSTPTRSNESSAAAQINAIANPETAKALQNLQNLLYTQAITDAEFQTAKNRLLGTQAAADSYAQVEKLAELHKAGILSDLEFANAKAKALGI